MQGPIDKTKISVVNLVYHDFTPFDQETPLQTATIVGWNKVKIDNYYWVVPGVIAEFTYNTSFNNSRD